METQVHLPAELRPFFDPVNQTIRVIPAGKHLTSENLEEKPIAYVLQHGYDVTEKGLIVLRGEGG